MNYASIDPLMGVQTGLKAFVAAVLGGIGNLPGAALGGLILGMVETFAGGIPGLSNYRDGIAFAILILILLFRPPDCSANRRWKKYDALRRQTIVCSPPCVAAPAVSSFSAQFNRYYLDIAIDIGINIILAVSLNLINGHTGQFSLGHAGFMAVGGYTAAKFTLVAADHCCRRGRSRCSSSSRCCSAACWRRSPGLAVGVPSLRLRGDYLAIVTLGFGEIIRVIFQNTEAVRRGHRTDRHSQLDQLRLGLGLRRGDGVRRRLPGEFHLRPRLHRRARRRDRRRRHGHQSRALQGHRLRHRRVLRGHRRRTVRASQTITVAQRLRLHEVHRDRGDGDPRRHGADRRRDRRGGAADVLPEVLRGFADYRMIIYSLLIIVPDDRAAAGTVHLWPKAAGQGMSAPLLQLDKVTIRFGGLTAVSELDLQIGGHELVGLIGPNGAGKTTVFNLITGVYQPTGGAISFQRPAHRRSASRINSPGSASPARSRTSGCSPA